MADAAQQPRKAKRREQENQSRESAAAAAAAGPPRKEGSRKQRAPASGTATAPTPPQQQNQQQQQQASAPPAPVVPARYTKQVHNNTGPPVGGNGASSSSSSSSSAPPPAATSAASSSSRFVFHGPPSLFRRHRHAPPSLGAFVMPGSSSPASPPAPVRFPPHYAPVNLLRLIRSLTPHGPLPPHAGTHSSSLMAAPASASANGSSTSAGRTHVGSSNSADGFVDYTLSQLWSFYDNPYGHEVSLLLDPSQLTQSTPTHGAASANAHADEGTEVYFVPYLSALVLYEAPNASGEASPPLLQWFERVSPHQRMPLTDQIASIASCFSPPPSSPLYASFAPFPSRRILQDLPVSALDRTRSWYAITWYPILHDPLTTPVLAGCFLTYHSFDMDARRRCPVQESAFSEVAAAAAAAAITPPPAPVKPATQPHENGADVDSPADDSDARLCPHCGDRHVVPSAAAAAASPPTSTSPAYLPLLAYLCHRVLPSTWYVASSNSPAAVQLNTLLHQGVGGTGSGAGGGLGPAASFAHLSLAHQPPRLTHADATRAMHAVLQQQQHPDFMHMTNTQPNAAK